MNSKRFHMIMLAIIALLFISLIGGAYGINKLVVARANKLTALKAKSLALAQEQTSLNKAKKDIQTYDKLDKIAQSVVPQDKNQAEAVREIVNIANNNDVSLGAISFPASTLGATPVAAPAATAAAAQPAVAAAGGNAKVGTLSQLQPVKNIPGIYQLLITVNGDSNQPVQYSKFISFLNDLEHNRRTAQVSTITLQPDAKNRNNLTFSLTLSEYIKP